MSNKEKIISNIKYIDDYITLDVSEYIGIRLIREDRLIQFLDLIPDTIISSVVEQISNGDLAPPLESAEFRSWAIRKRNLYKMNQSDLAREIGVRPEQVNRYEKKGLPLNIEHLIKIKEHFKG